MCASSQMAELRGCFYECMFEITRHAVDDACLHLHLHLLKKKKTVPA